MGQCSYNARLILPNGNLGNTLRFPRAGASRSLNLRFLPVRIVRSQALPRAPSHSIEEITLSTPAILALEDGSIFLGTSIGAEGLSTGEVVLYRHDRIPRNPDRSILLQADGHADLPSYWQLWRQRRRRRK